MTMQLYRVQLINEYTVSVFIYHLLFIQSVFDYHLLYFCGEIYLRTIILKIYM